MGVNNCRLKGSFFNFYFYFFEYNIKRLTMQIYFFTAIFDHIYQGGK